MAATVLPYLIVDNILKSLIKEGTHASLHAIVDIAVNGSMGATNYATMRGAITAARQARIRAVYAAGHFAHQIAVAATPAPPVGAAIPAAIPLVNAPLNPAEFPLICRCTQCFAFLCTFKGGIITVSGFTESRVSYLSETLSVVALAPGVDVAVGIIQRLPDAHLLLPQKYTPGPMPWPPSGHIFDITASHARPMKAYVKRIHALHAATPPINMVNYSAYIRAHRLAAMASWVDVDTLIKLSSWNIHFVTLSSTSLGTMFHRVIIERNPYRYNLLPWMEMVRSAGSINCSSLGNTSLNPAGGQAWRWPPIGAAIYLGDTVSVRALASIPGINLNLLAPVFGTLTSKTIGVAGPYALTWKALKAFKEWLSHATRQMEEAGQFNRIMDIMFATIKSCSNKRAEIRAEPLPAGTLIADHKRSKTRRRKIALDVALAFMYTIQEESFRTLRTELDGTMTVVKMYETNWYHAWVTEFKRLNRNPATRSCRDVVPLVNALDRTTNRITRSGRRVSDRR